MKWSGMLVLSLRDINQGFWSQLRCLWLRHHMNLYPFLVSLSDLIQYFWLGSPIFSYGDPPLSGLYDIEKKGGFTNPR